MSYANTFDEPVGGLMNVILTEDAQYYQHKDINGGCVLVINIGVFTTNWLAVNPKVISFRLSPENPQEAVALTFLDD